MSLISRVKNTFLSALSGAYKSIYGKFSRSFGRVVFACQKVKKLINPNKLSSDSHGTDESSANIRGLADRNIAAGNEKTHNNLEKGSPPQEPNADFSKKMQLVGSMATHWENIEPTKLSENYAGNSDSVYLVAFSSILIEECNVLLENLSNTVLTRDDVERIFNNIKKTIADLRWLQGAVFIELELSLSEEELLNSVLDVLERKFNSSNLIECFDEDVMDSLIREDRITDSFVEISDHFNSAIEFIEELKSYVKQLEKLREDTESKCIKKVKERGIDPDRFYYCVHNTILGRKSNFMRGENNFKFYSSSYYNFIESFTSSVKEYKKFIKGCQDLKPLGVYEDKSKFIRSLEMLIKKCETPLN